MHAHIRVLLAAVVLVAHVMRAAAAAIASSSMPEPLTPCNFSSSNGTWQLQQRVCMPGSSPLRPASLGPVAVIGAAAPPDADAIAGTTVWSTDGANSSLVATYGTGPGLYFKDINCIGCLDLGASSLHQLLVPQPLLRKAQGQQLSAASVGVSNVLVVGTGIPANQAAALLGAMRSSQAIQDITKDWSLAVYTDNTTYMMIPKSQAGPLSISASGAFAAAPSLVPPSGAAALAAPSPGAHGNNTTPSVNYALNVTNSTFHRVLREQGSISTDAPFLMILSSNVTVAPHPDLPPGGFNVTRPVYILGRDGVTTGLDFGGKVNLIHLSGAGNMTFDSLALDNLFPGDEESGKDVQGLSVTAAFNMYPVKWNRADRRLFIVRCSMGVPTQAEIERIRFFMAIFNSPDPELKKQAEWMRAGPKGSVSEIAVDGRPGLSVTLFMNKAMAYKDVYAQAANSVAPRLTFDPSTNVLAAAEQAAAAVGTPLHVPPITAPLNGPADLLAHTPLVRPTTIFVVPPKGADLSPAPELGWPPPNGLEVPPGPVPNTLIIFGDLPLLNSNSADSSGAQNTTSMSTSSKPPPAPINSSQQYIPLGTPVHHPLWLGYAVNLIVVPHGSQESVQLRGLTLVELGQGPVAVDAQDLQDPEVWTHLVWAVNSTLDEPRLLLVDCQLMLPSPELNYLKGLAMGSPDFQIQLYDAHAISFQNTTITPDGSLYVDSYVGAGLAGNQMLLSETRAPPPPGYRWPHSQEQPQSSTSSHLPPWAIALITIGAVGAAALLITAALFAARARRRRAMAGLSQSVAGGKKGKEARRASPGARSRSPGDEGGDDTMAVRDGDRVLAAAAAAAACDIEMGGSIGRSLKEGHGVAVVVEDVPGSSSARSPDDAEGRWQQLSKKIGKRISRIHMHKLSSALSEGVGVAGGGEGRPEGGGSSSDEEVWEGPSGGGGAAGGAALGKNPRSRGSDHPRSRLSDRADSPSLDLQLIAPIGQGSFGTVWRGVLQGRTDVAVKLMQLPDLSSLGPSGAHAAASIRERMVVQEAAIASAMTHPHVVSVFSVGLRPCRPPQTPLPASPPPSPQQQQQQQAGVPLTPDMLPRLMAEPLPGSSSVTGGAVLWQLTIVMEYCDQGTLRQALDRGRLTNPRTGRTHLPTALALARDVAAAMQYLHSQQVIHGDLKASNVLLKTAFRAVDSPARPGANKGGASSSSSGGGGGEDGGEGEGVSSAANLIQGGWVIAKICDFGLSSFLDTAGASTVLSSQICGGTLTHMSPELLTSNKPSKASDVYAFGVVLFEILTGERPYSSIPQALLGHAVVARRKRPAWPAMMGSEFMESKKLAEECWQHNPQARPSFHDIVIRLEALHEAATASAAASGRPTCLPGSCDLPIADNGSDGGGATTTLTPSPPAAAPIVATPVIVPDVRMAALDWENSGSFICRGPGPGGVGMGGAAGGRSSVMHGVGAHALGAAGLGNGNGYEGASAAGGQKTSLIGWL